MCGRSANIAIDRQSTNRKAGGAMASHYEVLIAGAGPAGLATGIHLLRQRPDLQGRVAAIDKAHHPRFKVCAGGLIPKAMTLLAELGIHLDVPAAEVLCGEAVTEAGVIVIPKRPAPLCTVVRRDQFDAMLARAAQQAGLEIIENTRISAVVQANDYVNLATSAGTFASRMLIGADGSGSRVRAEVFGRSQASIGRALMIDVPISNRVSGTVDQQRYQFDFRCVAAGIPGYSWSFPCMIGGVPFRNAGIYEWKASPSNGDRNRKSRLFAELHRAFPEIGIAKSPEGGVRFKSFPIRWYNPRDRYAAGRVILAGDAAGADPLMGEGISFALEHGRMAAEAALRFIDGDADALRGYDRALHTGYNARKLGRLAFAARRFYGPRHRLFFKLASLSRHAQQLGLDWYNGANGVDETSAFRIAARCLTSIVLRRDLPC
ncbi:MAG TPA: FAD-dependent monooxygenase [Candidatus Binataceae bacterium]|nr:FAD-dependent monooxygenase [Candidatus Binataceae bacterium]